jgi:hypothetical protein
VRVATPRLGQSFEPAAAVPSERWWPELPWQTAEQAPVISSPGGAYLELPREVER